MNAIGIWGWFIQILGFIFDILNIFPFQLQRKYASTLTSIAGFTRQVIEFNCYYDKFARFLAFSLTGLWSVERTTEIVKNSPKQPNIKLTGTNFVDRNFEKHNKQPIAINTM